LTHDEREFLVEKRGDDIILAFQRKKLSKLCAELGDVLQVYRSETPGKHIVLDRAEDKLYDVLKAQVKDRNGWFHVLHRQHKRVKAQIDEVRRSERMRYEVALAKQAEEDEAGLAERDARPAAKELEARIFQIVRGG
jgi:hypothetical protein